MLVFLLVFVFALFIYIHLLYQWKVSNEIDIPHITLPSKDTLEQVADTHQPFIFERNLNSNIYLEGIESDVNIFKNGESALKVPHKAMISAVKKEPYLSEKNFEFLEKTGWILDVKKLSNTDDLFKPHLNWSSQYDILYGNSGVNTELKCPVNGRNYFAVVEGTIELKLCTPRCGDFLREQGSKSNKSKINPWNPSEEDKISLKECDVILIPLKKGSVIHIPAFWWYSIKFPEMACVISLSYRTYMNALSQVPDKVHQLLQKNKIEI